MPNWANLMLTKQGKVLQAKAIAGSTLTITKMKLGSGIIPDGVSPEDLTDLIQPKQALGLTAISVNGGLAKIQSIVTNAELSEGYYIRECGVFANDPDVGEIMYAIMTDTSPDFLPSASSSVVISEEFSINVVTENMANITAIIDPEGIVTVANARKIAEDKVTEHNEDTEAHPNDFNLKGITIGKDNVIATKTIANRYYGGEVSGNLGDSLNLAAGYVRFQDVMGRDSGKDDGIWHVGAAYNFNNDLTLSGMYLNSNWDGERNSDDDGWTVGLNYKGAQASDAGSYGIFARYYDQGEGTYWEHTTDANTFWNTGFKGYAVGANYAVAKNIVATLAYYDTKAKTVTSEGSSLKDKRLWTDVTFTF